MVPILNVLFFLSNLVKFRIQSVHKEIKIVLYAKDEI